ncbi:MAG: sugar phosphate isomerase/epimerase family protein [Luteolibacter sp.]
MKRRSLLSMIPAASALVAMRSQGMPIPQPALTAAGFCITVQCWSFREFTLLEAIDMAAAAGMGGVELFPGQKLGGEHGDHKFGPDLPQDRLQAVSDYLKSKGLVASNFGVTDLPKDEVKSRKFFEMGKSLGLYGITTESIDAIDTAEKLAAEYDIKVCYHNHPKRPMYRMWDPDFVFSSVKDRHPNIGICADIGHWATSGMDPLAIIRRIAPRVHAFHMKDRASIDEWTHDRPFGTGVINIAAILDEVRKHGFAGNVSVEYEHNWKTSLPEIAQCVGYLRAYSMIRG